MAQAIYLLYKNVNQVSYGNTMRNMIGTLKGRLGINCSTEDVPMFRYKHAHLIKIVSGSCQKLKKDVINLLIDNRVGHGQVSIMCDYTCRILAWTDMGGMKIIKDELLATNSPVLRDTCVAAEVKNLARAFKLINGDEYPQYYRIRKPGIGNRFLEHARFLALIAVAERLRGERNGTVGNSIMSMSLRKEFVTELMNIHEAGMAG